MFPIRDDNPTFLTPYVTYGLIVLNVLAWIALQGFGSEPALSRSVCTFGLIPGELLGSAVSGERFPISDGEWCVVGEGPVWRTALTSMFMHGGWMHLAGNLWFLWIFGNNVEDSMGHVRFAVFYILCGFAAAAAQILSDGDSIVPMVGASGAIGGVMGAYILLFPRVNVHMILFPFFIPFAVPAVLMLGYWLVLQLFGGFQSLTGAAGGVAFWAHIGGFAAGSALILVFKNERLLARHPFRGWSRAEKPTRAWRSVNWE